MLIVRSGRRSYQLHLIQTRVPGFADDVVHGNPEQLRFAHHIE
jgi:hypothetical protein